MPTQSPFSARSGTASAMSKAWMRHPTLHLRGGFRYTTWELPVARALLPVLPAAAQPPAGGSGQDRPAR